MRNSKLPGFMDRHGGPSTEYNVPVHTQEALEHYLISGFQPGGFLSSMLAMNMERAVYNADVANKQAFVSIARWIIEYAPKASWGSYQAIDDWCADKDGRRTKYGTNIEKEYVARVLKEGV